MFQHPDPLQAGGETDVTGALLRLAETIAGHTHLDTLLPTIVELATTVTGCDGCVLSLWDEHRARFLPAAAFGLSPRLRRIFYGLPVAPGDLPLVDEMVRRRGPVSANAPDPLLPANLWRRVNKYTILGVPLLHHERIMGGMIMLYERGKKGYGPRQTPFVNGIARQIALAIASARAFEAERRRHRDLETLQETIAVLTAELEFATLYRRIVRRAAITFAAPAAALILYCPTEAGYTTCRPLLDADARQASRALSLTAAHGLSASYVQQQRISTDLVHDLLQTHPDARPFALPDLRLSPLGDLDLIQEEGLRAALVILLQRGDHFLGLLTVYRRSAPLDFDDDALALAQTLGHQTVIALENARLYQQAQDRSRQLAQVLAVGHQVRANQDTSAILQHIAAGIRQGLNWRAVLIARYDHDAGHARGAASAGDLPQTLDRLCHPTPLEHWRALYEHEQYRISRSYFVAAERGGDRIARESTTWDISDGPRDEQKHARATATQRADALVGRNWQPNDLLVVPIQDRLGELLGVIVVDAPQHGQRPALADVQALEIFADQAAVAIENVQLYTALQIERGRLRALSTRLTQAQEAERTRIARELHDEAGQALTAVRLQLDFVTSILPSDVPLPVRRQIKQAQNLIGRTLQEIRRISIDLRPSLLDDLGLTPALRWQCDHLSRHANLAIRFESTQDTRRLDANVETAVYRAAQEALTNIVRHAQATVVEISLEYQDERLDLTISDNGRGFPEAPGQEIGLGLIGIRERLSAVGGALHIDSQPGTGSTLYIQVPLSPRPSLAGVSTPPQEEAL
ncbi:MAG: GAF domain-containing protein [Anaerolineae bacterium]|jgi:signal transduction histidine kinase